MSLREFCLGFLAMSLLLATYLIVSYLENSHAIL